MHKVIKKFKENEIIYKLGYDLYAGKVYPCIVSYKNKKLLSGGYWNDGTIAGLLNFRADESYSNVVSYISTIKEMFAKLRQYNEIPEYIEREFEELFLLYKLNDFNEL